jgi:PKHD-type hydroxylase
MLIRVPKVLHADQVQIVRRQLDSAGAAWVDGRATAGHQGAQVKFNLQIAEDAPVARELGATLIEITTGDPLAYGDAEFTVLPPSSIACRNACSTSR